MKALELTKRIVNKDTLNGIKQFFPRGHFVVIAGLSSLLLTAAVTSYSAKEPVRTSQTVALLLTPASLNTKIEIAPPIIWHKETVKAGDSLSLLFNRAGLSDVVLYNFLNSNKSAPLLSNIHPGQEIAFHLDEGQLKGLRYQKSRLNSIEFTRTDTGFTDNNVTVEPDKHTAYREATIINSLFLAGTDAGMEESLIMELANIFGWDIDFALDIRTNDTFKVLYEERFINGEKIGNGPILAAAFTNQNKTYSAVRYENDKGNADYYTPAGKSMRKAFLRTPVDFARISSHFNLKRKHPILNRIRAHKGTDYAAPRGTPIKAAGNGKVAYAGVKGGYGRTVIIRHGQSYKTLYAHMYKYGRGIRTGAKVKQGQIIGYVGKSGLATGPHLHYEFYKNGAVRNPVRVALPKAKSIDKSLLKDFELQTRPLVAQLDQFTNKTQLALSAADSATDSATN
jgi:murein DD-endopeptidase MepM/ murein hydrolase activator NlpD